jgi:hypothetical protein
MAESKTGTFRRVADQRTCLCYIMGVWERDDFWTCQSEEGRIILQDLLRVRWWEFCGVVQ